MRHLTFPKISTTPSPQAGGSPGGPWVAQEKIHGAQLIAGVSARETCFGKRKAWLREDEPFFGWQLVRVELTRQVRAIREELRVAEADELFVYGELFGGRYPHPAVASVPGMMPVQTGIWYAPDLRWSVFDAVVGETFVDACALAAAVTAAGGITPPVLGRGRKNELSFLNERFATKVPATLGLPEIDGNWAEGLVLKPEGAAPIATRAVLKRKIEEFDEKQFDESAAWDETQRLTPAELAAWARKMTNAARIASARSKVGDGDAAALGDEVVLDVMVDLTEAFPTAMAGLTPEQEAELRAAIMAAL